MGAGTIGAPVADDEVKTDVKGAIEESKADAAIDCTTPAGVSVFDDVNKGPNDAEDVNVFEDDVEDEREFVPSPRLSPNPLAFPPVIFDDPVAPEPKPCPSPAAPGPKADAGIGRA